MIKKYKKTLIITSIITISPMLVGLLLWNRLPDMIATHFGSDNTVDGWSSKPFAVFGLPLMLLAIHLLCVFVTSADPKRKNISDKFFKWILWIVPILSVAACLACYAVSLGVNVDMGMIINILVGIVFIIVGNYMHKVKQNYTVGIKLPWTLDSEENWNRTHRMASWLWMIAGIIFIVNAILQIGGLVIPVLVVLLLVPIVYSYLLYRKGI